MNSNAKLPKIFLPINNPASSPTAETKLRLIVFPHAGAAPANYRSWRRLLPLTVEFLAVNLPGRGLRSKEPFASKLEDVVQEVVEGLKALPKLEQIPIAFYGHSMGSMVAFGVAQELQKQRRQASSSSSLPIPVKLFVSGRRAAHVPMPEGVQLWSQLTEAQLLERIRIIGGTPEEILNNKEMMDLFLPILRSDFDLLDRYSDKAVEAWLKDEQRRKEKKEGGTEGEGAGEQLGEGFKLRIPISYFGGNTDPFVTEQEGGRWKEVTTEESKFYTKSFDSGHFFVQQCEAQVIEALVNDEELRKYLS